MKKKIVFCLVAAMLVFIGFMLFGCGKTEISRVEENMSEWTKVYYYAEGQNFCASLSSGLREKEYIMNGKAGENVDFALLTITPTKTVAKSYIKADITINDVKLENQELDLNASNGGFMIDLEQFLNGDEQVVVSYAGETLSLENLSKSFEIDHKKALEIATEELADKILLCRKGVNLNAECYLRVLDKKLNSLDGTFWCFSVVNINGDMFSIVISTLDGTILAKSE